MRLVKTFTPPDFQAKNFTPLISQNFNSFGGKNTKNEWNLHGCQKIYTAAGSDSSDKSHLCSVAANFPNTITINIFKEIPFLLCLPQIYVLPQQHHQQIKLNRNEYFPQNSTGKVDMRTTGRVCIAHRASQSSSPQMDRTPLSSDWCTYAGHESDERMCISIAG